MSPDLEQINREAQVQKHKEVSTKLKFQMLKSIAVKLGR